MSDTPTTEPTSEATITTEGAVTGTPHVVEPTEPPTDDGDTFPRQVVEQLRQEAAEARVKAKMTDVANEHLLAAYAAADGRLQAVEFLPAASEVLGDDGLVSRDKVTEAIGALLAERPYLAQRRAAPLPGGVRTDPTPELGWVDLLRGAGR